MKLVDVLAVLEELAPLRYASSWDDVFVTGEVRHHDAVSAARCGVTVIATLHSNSERAAVRAYAGRLAARLSGLGVAASVADADPFVIV